MRPYQFKCSECHRAYRNEGQVQRHRAKAQGECIKFVSPALAKRITRTRELQNTAINNPIPKGENT